ncbi:ABC transporter ATP-binding protein [Xanthobacter sp. VNH20]|uniref:ABC transporter ATP-binding protein n=1 Tax=Xanthobacter sp. VNH20 TaxID=3156616 RepID=UPI0032B4DB1F
MTQAAQAATPIRPLDAVGWQLVEFSGVAKDFTTPEGPFRAVQDVNLEVRRGEVVTLVGPSGCGKSTLLNMTAGLFVPTAGKVSYDGREIRQINTKTGYMTQNDHLLPWRNVLDNIAVPLEIAGLSRSDIRARVQVLIDMVGLTGFEQSFPTQLSGGMRKRAALARLLAYDPETLLLDEPFAALDAQMRLKMQVELLSISRKLNKTVLFVTHDLDEAVGLGDRIAVFSPRPGTIRRLITSPLGHDRDLLRLRHEPAYASLCAELWDMIVPSIESHQ